MLRLLSAFSFAMVCSVAAFGAEAKIDEASPMTGGSFRPVFVRMEDQLFRKAEDHEAFCKKHGDRPRSQNRKEITAVLRQKAAGSWRQIEELVTKLEKEGGVRGPRRFWIVNGFACSAKPEAIKA